MRFTSTSLWYDYPEYVATDIIPTATGAVVPWETDTWECRTETYVPPGPQSYFLYEATMVPPKVPPKPYNHEECMARFYSYDAYAYKMSTEYAAKVNACAGDSCQCGAVHALEDQSRDAWRWMHEPITDPGLPSRKLQRDPSQDSWRWLQKRNRDDAGFTD